MGAMHTPPSSLDDLLTSADVLRLTGRTSHSAVTAWVDAGRLPVARQLTGTRGTRLFLRADVDRLVAELRDEAQARIDAIDAGATS